MGIDEMSSRQDGMTEHHTRPGIAHYFPDLGADIFLVTVQGAAVTHRFLFTEGASFEAPARIVDQIQALTTKTFLRRVMVGPAVEADHHLHRPPFAF